MRFLHTSDWHLGRAMAQESLLDDQALVLDQVFDILVETGAQAIVIAGDIFDRAVPRREAVDLFDRFLTRVYRETGSAIIALAGNHDAPERIGFGGALQDPARVLIRGPMNGRPHPLMLADDDGPVAFSALPFGEVHAARGHFDDPSVAAPADVLERQVAEARLHVPEGARWVVAAHAFVQGGAATETERSLDFVGGIETVPHAVFDGANYVALGHLHRAQAAGAEHIRYCGSPMAFGFDEAGLEKGLLVVDLERDRVGVETRPLVQPRAVRVIEGHLEDLVRAAGGCLSEDFIKAVLLDAGELVDPMGRLRTVYPNALQIQRRERPEAQGRAAFAPGGPRRAPMEVVDAFLADVRGEGLTDVERPLVLGVLEAAVGEAE